MPPLTLSLVAARGVGWPGVVRPLTGHDNPKLIAPPIGCTDWEPGDLGNRVYYFDGVYWFIGTIGYSWF